MGLYNFQRQFVPFIKDGRKQHTIRAKRVNPDKPGNVCHLYEGLRTKKAKLILRAPCVKVEEIRIDGDGRLLASDPFRIVIDGHELALDEREALARRDGFSNFQAMMNFWNGRLPFDGHIIHWKFSK